MTVLHLLGLLRLLQEVVYRSYTEAARCFASFMLCVRLQYLQQSLTR